MPVRDGRLHLGTWEQIHYAEFDGQRNKRILVKVVGVMASDASSPPEMIGYMAELGVERTLWTPASD